MRTTITLERDVAQRLKAETSRSGRTFKQVVNDTLRAGLERSEKPKAKPFRTKGKNMGLRPGINLDNIGELLAQLEGEDYRVILVDANILLYAENTLDPRHDKARRWWDSQLSRAQPVCLCWSVINAFLRIGTNARVFKNALTLDESIARVKGWLDQPCLRLIAPTDDHWTVFSRLLRDGQAHGNLVTDAHLAALAIQHGCELMTTDADFARFPGLRWRNPLI